MTAIHYVFLNGRIIDARRATVSVYDRGLLYGDGLFETMRAYKGVAFAVEEHFHRLRTSADILGLPIPDRDWPATIGELLDRNGLARRDAWVRLTVTRGPADPGILPPDVAQPTVILMARALDPAIGRYREAGMKVALLPFAPDGFIPEHKSINYLPAVVGKVLASYHGAQEGLFVKPGQVVTEGTTSSLFAVREGVLYTPPPSGILPGITRAIVLDLARAHHIPAEERAIAPADLRIADEAFLTSSIIELAPIVELDGRPLGSGRPGPLTRQLAHLYSQAVAAYVKAKTGRAAVDRRQRTRAR
ncbi:MAG: aminotransferase class IV [Candidatus Binatia bacterium]